MLRLEILSREDLDLAHDRSLEILEKTGVIMQDQEILLLFEKAGANVDKKQQIVKIPRNIVNEALKKVPRLVTFYSRDRKNTMRIGENGSQYFTTGGAIPFVLDHKSHERREATTKDTIDRIRLIDAMTNIDSIETSPGIWPQDVPAAIRDVFVSLLTFENTEKHYGLETVGPSEAHEYCIRMASVVAGGEEELRKYPIIHASAEPIGTLLWDEHALRNMRLYADHGLPVDIACTAVSGLTSPSTLIGTLVHGNAGFLSGVVASQLINPGNPIGRFGSGAVSDLRTGKVTMGSVEAAILDIATGQVGRYYKIPTMAVAGIPDTNTNDIQSGYETALTMLLVALGGVSRVQNGGLLATATISSLEKLVIDDEIIDMVKYSLEGLTVSKEKIPIDLIHEIGPHGSFLGNRKALEFTRKYLRSEHFIPNLGLRIDWDLWTKMNKRTVNDKAQEKVEKTLETHNPIPLSQDIDREIRFVYKEASKALLK